MASVDGAILDAAASAGSRLGLGWAEFWDGTPAAVVDGLLESDARIRAAELSALGIRVGGASAAQRGRKARADYLQTYCDIAERHKEQPA